MELNDLISKIEDLQKDIRDYIENTEHYIFNWIDDKEVQHIIMEYPNEYENMFHINVIKVGIFPIIRIHFIDHPDGVKYIDRDAILTTFKDTSKARWLNWNDKLREKQIAEKEEEIEYFKKKLEESEKKLEELKRN